MAVSLEVNGLQHTVDVADATPLLFVLRNDLGLNGAKLGCGAEQCGSCTVLVDGEPTYSCTARAGDVVGKRLLTVEGLSDDGVSHPLQAAFLELNAGQCGYCLAGIIMASCALLAATPSPTRAQICQALAGHLCRCGAHPRIVAAILRAAAMQRATKLEADR